MDTQDNKDLNNYDFLTLLGLQNVPQEDKLRISHQLTSLVWEKFLLEKLEKELEHEGINEVNNMIEENENIEEIMAYITKQVPHLKDILEVLLADTKKEIMKEHYQKMLEESDKAMFNPSFSEKDQESARERKNRYLCAKDFFDREDWQQLYGLMSFDSPLL